MISALVAVLAFFATWRQSIEARRSNAVNALLPFFERWNDPEMKRLRGWVYEEAFDVRRLSDAELDDVRKLLDQMEFLGSLVVNGIVDFDVVRSIDSHSPPKVWAKLRPFVEEQRVSGTPAYAVSSERLVERYGVGSALAP